jgi:DNA-binding SARP family transcriptional activator
VAPVEIRILGPLEVLADEHAIEITSARQRALLTLLAVNANRVVTPDRIVEDVWGTDTPASGTKVLAFHVSRLRDALAPGRRSGEPSGGLETEAGGYVLRVDPDAIDAVHFERLAHEAHRRLPEDPVAAHAILDDALGLWRGDALADVAYAEFAQPEIRRLEELRLGGLEDRLDAELRLGGHLEAVAALEDLLASNPLRERVRGLLMLALYRSGRQAEALRVGGAGRRLLSEELGIDPSPDLVRLEAQILAQDPELDSPAPLAGARTVRARNPYKGLRAFGEADSADFFGRETLVGRLATRVEEVAHAGRLLVVVGPSGSGKSSVVRAGLIPVLRGSTRLGTGAWQIVTMVPGQDPYRELAAALQASGQPAAAGAVEGAEVTGNLATLLGEALPTDGGRMLLVIDQLDELFVRVDEETGSRFLAGIGAAVAEPGTPLVVVATLRADFLHVPLALPGFGELVRNGTELIGPLARAELERAIVRPAAAVGVEVDPALAVEVVGDVEHRPGVLPLLEYALTELFDRSDGRRLTRDGYAAIGGAIGALGRRADEAWRSLDRDDRDVAQQVLLALVDVADSGVATARRVPRAELDSTTGGAEGRVQAILDELGRRGLLTFDLDRVSGAPTVEIAHEALIVHWPRLADWIDDLREDLRTRRRLTDAAHDWDAGSRSAEDLASGTRLDRFLAYARGTRLRVGAGERSYLDASVAERDRLEKVEVERSARESQTERRARAARRALVGVMVLGLLFAGGLSAALFAQGQAAVEQDAVVSAGGLAASSVASLGKSRQLSVLLALEAANATAHSGYVVEDAYDALQWALQEAQVPFPSGRLPSGVRMAPDGPRSVFLVGPETLVRLGIEYVRRFRSSVALSADECRPYVREASCRPIDAPAAGVVLGIRTATRGVVPAASLPTVAGASSHVRALSELPVDVSSVLASVEGRSGVTVDWGPAAGGSLEGRLDARDIPDIAIVSRPSYVVTAARDGWLVPLDGLIDSIELAAEVGPYAMGLGRVTDTRKATFAQYALPIAASVDDLLWYPKAAFAAAGYRAPATGAELRDLVAAIERDGRTPWCLGLEAGNRSGTAAAAWVEDAILDVQGPAGYDSWVAGQTSFADPEVTAAFDALGTLVARPPDVLEGLAGAAWIGESVAALPMLLAEGPRCWLYRGSSSDRLGFPAGMAMLAAVPFPGGSTGATGGSSPAVLGRLYQVVVLHDRPDVRQVVAELVGAPFAAAVTTGLGGSGIFAVRSTTLPSDTVMAAVAGRLRSSLEAGTFRVRGVDLLPAKVASAFLEDVMSYLTEARFEGSRPSTDGMEWSADGAWAEVRNGSP